MKNNFSGIKKELEKKSYAIVGNSSGVQICNWTKNSLKGEGVCWKEKFYGIKSHGCCQFSPSLMWCENKCLHCWRPIELNLGDKIDKIDDPIEILNKVVEARKKLLTGFGGLDKVSKKKWKEAQEPSLFSFSLSGEPTLYPRLDEMISEIRRRKAISFIVTNGQNPEMILKLSRASISPDGQKNKNSLPTQLTLSTNAPNKELFDKWHSSCKKDAWERFNETLKIIKTLKGKCRRCIRLTLVRKGLKGNPALNNVTNMTEELIPQYVGMIITAQPDFIHVKGYTSIGYARNRMGHDKMPWFYEVKDYAKKILAELKEKDNKDWKILTEDERSCVVVIGKNKKDMKIKKV
jgi:tRNA wybutosine-synthesizing protein 1